MHFPRKRFGQHFLRDTLVIQQLVDVIAPNQKDDVVEIGPGQGVLTRALLPRVKTLTAIEIDRDLVPALKKMEQQYPQFRVIEADALTFDFKPLPYPKVRLVGNLPYNISTPLLFHWFSQLKQIVDIHIMLQKEVVDRLGASVGSADYGRLSVMAQWYCQAIPLFEVPASAFYPRPRVISQVVRLIPHQKPLANVQDITLFEEVVRRAFMQRRKTLRNALRTIISAEELKTLEINPDWRPQNLSVVQYAAISRFIEEKGT
jgi:16S rRNA (adenine1518-N6/adenine1519-N6)-dimethyltransferase